MRVKALDRSLFDGTSTTLPFSDAEHEARLSKLGGQIAEMGFYACVLTSMHNVAFYSGFLNCAFGRPYSQVVAAIETVTFSAGIDEAQPWRRGFYLSNTRGASDYNYP